MRLGFVSAILPELDLEEVFRFAGQSGFETVELMCWPPGRVDRRYAGVTHLDATAFGADEAHRVREMMGRHNVGVSSLGYYPNPLCRDEGEASVYINHLRKVISAAGLLGVGLVTTFIGRDPAKSIDDNWEVFDRRWPPIVAHAETCGVQIAIENCPMLFSADEWPGGKNLAISPRVWREMFRRIPSPRFGLNFDPSHFILQFMDPVPAIIEFSNRIFHVHAKDLRIHKDVLNDRGILDFGWAEPKLPGLGEVNWPGVFAALTDARYTGPVCIEVEDRAFEGSTEDRKRSLIQSRRFLQNYVI